MEDADKDAATEVYEKFGTCVQLIKKDTSQHIVFCPPTAKCLLCKNINLSKHNDANTIRFYTVTGVEQRKKVNLRCSKCMKTYQVARYGDKNAFRMYDEEVDVIEVTDGVFMDRKLHENYCNLQ